MYLFIEETLVYVTMCFKQNFMPVQSICYHTITTMKLSIFLYHSFLGTLPTLIPFPHPSGNLNSVTTGLLFHSFCLFHCFASLRTHLSISIQLISLDMILPSSAESCSAKASSSFQLSLQIVPIVYRQFNFCIHSSVVGYLGRFYILMLQMNIEFTYLLEFLFLFPLDRYLVVELLDHMVDLFFN